MLTADKHVYSGNDTALTHMLTANKHGHTGNESSLTHTPKEENTAAQTNMLQIHTNTIK